MIRFGPAGLGGVNEAIKNLKDFSDRGLNACEIAFTYGIYITDKDALEIGKAAKKFKIELSIHAPYWINLNSEEKKKIEESKKRIVNSCEIASYLGAKRVVFHSGFYGKKSKEESFENIKNEVKEIMKVIEGNNWDVELCPEVMGKKNVFGSIEEISELSKQSGCGFCIDFAHILARYDDYSFELVEKYFPQKKWHCHFSGIEYSEKGEKRHKKTEEKEWEKVLKFLKKTGKEAIIINESPEPVEDSVMGLKVYKKLL